MHLNADSITALTKLLYEAKALGIHLGPKSIKIDLKSDKRYIDQCKESFQRMPPAIAAAANGKDNGESMQDEIGQLMGNGDEMVSNSMYEGSTKDSKKAPEVI